MNILQKFLTLALICGVSAKIYQQCEFARELSKNGVPRYLISSYVCLGKTVSGLNANKLTNKTLSDAELGIFQISSKNYCKFGSKAGGKCNMKCQDLLNDNIADDIQCAKKIQDSEGFNHWSKWLQSCKNTDRLPNLLNCGHR